jgi:cellulose synthase/poly-beta-1,6-N-acetylglucosamine synthase-like glycosyltransferase
MQHLLLFFYLLPLLFIFAFSLVQLSLIGSYLKSKKTSTPILENTTSFYPMVVVQLPIYNEKYVVERLLDAVAALQYPADKLEIQLLDDSDDETTALIQQKLSSFTKDSFKLVRRPNRSGFKAGALAYGLQQTQAEFVAIFDADFVPSPDFLVKTIPHFQDATVGVVQTRWTHLNENQSLLTKLQAFGLDAHFVIEQGGRNAAKHYINFNGTAGVWRKTTIEDAGGWSDDTLTEDLDLSYRAQLRGWQFIYREDVESPAELPVAIHAIKSQQYRWMKGGAECFVKNGKKLLFYPKLRISDRFHGFFHLLNSSIFVAVFALALLSIPLLFVTNDSIILFDFYKKTALFQVNWLILGVFYWISFRHKSRSVFQFSWRFFWYLTFMLGLSFHNSVAVIEGWLGRKTPFIRTPKFGKENLKTNSYLARKLNGMFLLELAFALLFLCMVFVDIAFQNYGMLLFHFMLALGFGSVVFWTANEVRK